MGNRKPKEARLPPVRVLVQAGPVGPAQRAAWARLWAKLTQIDKAPAPGGKPGSPQS